MDPKAHPQARQIQPRPLQSHTEPFATVASDAAAAVAKVGGIGDVAGSTTTPKQPHDPNVHPGLVHDGAEFDDSTAGVMNAPGDDAMDEDDEGGDDEKTELSTPSSKERNSLTLDQRRALRRWANDQNPRPSHKACIQWFFGKYGQHISQSTVSHSLSPKYSRLDSVAGDNLQLSGSRLRFGNWPDIERMVLVWYQQVQASGRNPTNEELGDKAKMIFVSLPRYRDEKPPEFSPGWIHRFKKRYGLLVRRHRRSGPLSAQEAVSLNEDIAYLTEQVPRFMSITADTSAAAIKESTMRVIGLEPSIHTCALVRDEVVRRLTGTGHAPKSQGDDVGEHDLLDSGGEPMYVDDTEQQQQQHHHPHHHPHHHHHPQQPTSDQVPNPEMILQEHIRLIQQEHDEAEANAAAVRAERDRDPQPPLATPSRPTGLPFSGMDAGAAQTPGSALMTPLAEGAKEAPVRCPFCLNTRMLRTIKEAVEHLSTHVIV